MNKNIRIEKTYWNNGQLRSEYYYQKRDGYYDGFLLHNPIGPAYKEWDYEGNLTQESYYINGKLHRENGSAMFKNYQNSCTGNWFETALSFQYYIDGKLHREDGPAIINKNKDGYIIEENFYNDGELHNDNGPAIITYHKIDNHEIFKHLAEYYRMGELHREDGPAVIKKEIINEKITIIEKSYYINGELYRKGGPALQQWSHKGILIKEVFQGLEMNEKI